MEGVIAVGKLKRIEAAINQFFMDKISNPEIEFDWDKNVEFIKRGRGQLLPVTIDSVLKLENQKNVFYERRFIENQLKSHFLQTYSSLKPK